MSMLPNKQLNSEGKFIGKSFLGTKSRTKSEFAKECDINSILHKYKKNKILPQMKEGNYFNTADVGDYKSCLDRLQNANEAFQSLPSRIRNRFQNDPEQLIAFMADPDNKKEAIELGLLERLVTDEEIINLKPAHEEQVQTPQEAEG